MFLARVQGHVVASAKDAHMIGHRIIVVEPLKIDYEHPQAAACSGAQASGSGTGERNRGGGTFQVTGRAIVALDPLGAGNGQLVLICQGSSARLAEGMKNVPVDAVVVGIVDETVVLGGKVS